MNNTLFTLLFIVFLIIAFQPGCRSEQTVDPPLKPESRAELRRSDYSSSQDQARLAETAAQRTRQCCNTAHASAATADQAAKVLQKAIASNQTQQADNAIKQLERSAALAAAAASDAQTASRQATECAARARGNLHDQQSQDSEVTQQINRAAIEAMRDAARAEQASKHVQSVLAEAQASYSAAKARPSAKPPAGDAPKVAAESSQPRRPVPSKDSPAPKADVQPVAPAPTVTPSLPEVVMPPQPPEKPTAPPAISRPAHKITIDDLPPPPPALPDNRPLPAGIVQPTAPAAPTPIVRRLRQVDGGNGGDFLPGGYDKNDLSFRVDGLLEVTRTIGGVIQTWRIGYKWNDDKSLITLGSDADTRPSSESLKPMSIGGRSTTPPTQKMPVTLDVIYHTNGRVQIDNKTYKIMSD